MNPVLDLSPRLSVLPIIYGSGDFAMETRRRLQIMKPDCIAVALPPSFADAVEEGIARLPQITLAIQREISLEGDYNCVPIDPCQGVIAALRMALETGVDRVYVDLEVGTYEEQGVTLPDPYALKEVALEKLLAALMPALTGAGTTAGHEPFGHPDRDRTPVGYGLVDRHLLGIGGLVDGAEVEVRHLPRPSRQVPPGRPRPVGRCGSPPP